MTKGHFFGILPGRSGRRIYRAAFFSFEPERRVRYVRHVGLDHLTVRIASLTARKTIETGWSPVVSGRQALVLRGGKQIRARVREAYFVQSRFRAYRNSSRAVDSCALVQAHVECQLVQFDSSPDVRPPWGRGGLLSSFAARAATVDRSGPGLGTGSRHTPDATTS